MVRNFKSNCLPACYSWLNFCVQGQFEIKILPVQLINTTYFLCIKTNWTWACDHFKTSNLSADMTSRKYLTLMGRYLSLWLGQVILFSIYPVLTAASWSQYGWTISDCTWAPKLARKCEIKHWLPCGADGRLIGQSVGRSVGWSGSWCTVRWLSNFLGWIDLLSSGATL